MTKASDKRDRAGLFRERLSDAMAEAAMTQSALARQIGADRSTVSQLLKPGGTRLPNAQLVAECAAALGVSADWLLGLSERPEKINEVLASALSMPEAPRALVDEHIFQWHKEAAGYKIRLVPAGLPDILKTRELLLWEFQASLGRTTDQAIQASEERLEWMRGSRSDYEIAMPHYELLSMARGEGYYRGLDRSIRLAQLERIAQLHDQLYPSMRLYLYDERQLYSSPVTVFGPLIAVLYLGHNYIAFRDIERVDAITRHFDRLVREATVDPTGLGDLLASLCTEQRDAQNDR